MNVLRTRFLGTASFLSAPDDAGATGGKPTTLNENIGAEDDGSAAARGSDASAEAGQDAGDAGDDAGGDGAGNEGDDGEGADGDGDDDPDLADLPPEVRAKVRGVIQKKVTQETTWRDRQIDRLHAKRRAAEGEVQTAQTIVSRQPVTDDPNRKYTADEVKAEAAKLSAQQQYDADANAAFVRGQDVYGSKWSGVMAKLPKLGGVDVTDMMDILATDKPHVVLYSLADPEVYERVMALPPARRRTELVKLSLGEEPKKPGAESGRPGDVVAPVRPLQTGRRTAAQTVDLYDDKTGDESWYAARNASRRKKFSSAN